MKNVEHMTRPEIVQELRKHLPTSVFHHVIQNTTTPHLASILMRYRMGENPFDILMAFTRATQYPFGFKPI